MNRSCEDRVPVRLIDLHSNCKTLAITIFGYIIPVLSVFVTIGNILAIIVFLKLNVKSNVTLIFILIAGVDMIGIACPSVVFVYHYIFGYYKEFLTCRQLKVTYILGRICENIFKTISIWLTVLLSFIRCRCIKYPFTSRGIISSKTVALCIACIYTIVCVVHVPVYFTFDFQSLKDFHQSQNITYFVCGVLETEGWIFKSCSRRKAHVALETVLDSILPCVLLIYFNTVMLYMLRKAKINRSSLRRNMSSDRVTKYDERFTQKQKLNKEKNEDDLKTFDYEQDKTLERNLCNLSPNDIVSEGTSPTKERTHESNIDVYLHNLFIVKDKRKRPRDPTLDKLDSESRRTSWLIFAVSSIILLHEIPLAVANSYTITHHTEKPLPLNVNGCFSIIQMLWQFITYPVIFLISSCMSKTFRLELMKTIFCTYICKKKS